MVAFDANTLASTTEKEHLENKRINDWEVASVLVFQVCFGSNCWEMFQTVTSGMQIGGVTVQNHASGLWTATSIKMIIECLI